MQFRISYKAFDEVYIEADDPKSALAKGRRKLKKTGKYIVERSRQCEGSWNENCQNEIPELDARYGRRECRRCQYEREEDRINSPG